MDVKELHRRVISYVVTSDTPKKAAAYLRTVIAELEALAVAQTDEERVKIFNKFEKRFLGHGKLSDLVCMSALANPSKATLAGQRRCEKMNAKVQRDHANIVKKMARVLRKGTGLAPELCHKIMAASFRSRPMNKAWPVEVTPPKNKYEFEKVVVTGPRGKMPLNGEGSPGWIVSDLGERPETLTPLGLETLDGERLVF